MITFDRLVGNPATLALAQNRVENWYRSFGQSRYHKAAENWLASGKAVCGADIKNPAFVVPASNVHQDIKKCARCTRTGSHK